MKPGCLVFETGKIFEGLLFGDTSCAGESVFNTSATGYEEIASDPSYYNQILVMTSPLQGNYQIRPECWQSENLWIKGFVCLEIQNSLRDKTWLNTLNDYKIPVLSAVDTRQITLYLTEHGSLWSAIVSKNNVKKALSLIKEAKALPKDWTQAVSLTLAKEFKGQKKTGPSLALIDFGYKKNILNEMLKRASAVKVFPSASSIKDIELWDPAGVLLSNGPGDPKNVIQGTKLTKELLKRKTPIFGICMGHQVLSQALGAKTYRLKFGHRGSNHPIKDHLLNKIYISAQNHGYAVKEDSLPKDVKVSHINLNDNTVAGIVSQKRHCMSVQFHPENHPGPKEADQLFDFFIKNFVKKSSKILKKRRR